MWRKMSIRRNRLMWRFDAPKIERSGLRRFWKTLLYSMGRFLPTFAFFRWLQSDFWEKSQVPSRSLFFLGDRSSPEFSQPSFRARADVTVSKRQFYGSFSPLLAVRSALNVSDILFFVKKILIALFFVSFAFSHLAQRISYLDCHTHLPKTQHT